ncbi:MAG: cation:proton antiporter regulatory subunit [Halanaerobiales bacterium]
MRIKETELPGVGKKYSFRTAEGLFFVTIIHHNGDRELYFLKDEEAEEAEFCFKLTDEEARRLGTLLVGADYQPVTEHQARLLHEDILVEWVEVQSSSWLTDKMIKEAEIRTRIGVTVIGIQRGEEMIGSPDIDEKIFPGDILMVTGKKDNIDKFKKWCRGENSS